MIICGIKLTHDGAVALIENGELKFCVEMEKIQNNPRYSEITDSAIIGKILNDNGYFLKDVDCFAIDGWAGLTDSFIKTKNQGEDYIIQVAPYREKTRSENLLTQFCFNGLKISDEVLQYESYFHVTNHITSAYCTSPFAAKGESSFVLVWDGGMFPRLYYYDYNNKTIQNLGKLFYLMGNIYSEFSQYFNPFKKEKPVTGESLSVAGKLMAYIAKGKVNELILKDFEFVLENHLELSLKFSDKFATKFIEISSGKNYRDEDILASFHVFLQNKLIEGLNDKIKGSHRGSSNLCFVGGCALNIKWNSAIRESGLFKQMWVPPFPNDSGSAIGAACSAWMAHTGQVNLKWNVYSGPSFINNESATGWLRFECKINELARFIDQVNEPIVLLNGRAELGPRALGNRSIISAATDRNCKSKLNHIKQREDYRPIAPICIEELAPMIFEPGSPDPYMLYDHQVKEEWIGKIPVICHLDGTARLQTVSLADNPTLYQLLCDYYNITGIPVLSNTSANLNGTGFFPNLSSAMEWGKVNYIWSDNVLYAHPAYELFLDNLKKIDHVADSQPAAIIKF